MTNGNPRSFLTDDDRAYLKGERELTEGSEYNTKRRIRERTQQTIIDFSLLFEELDDDERGKIFQGQDAEFDNGLANTLAFILRSMGVMDLTQPSRKNPEACKAYMLLREAIQRAGLREGYRVEDIDLEIEAEWYPLPNIEKALEEGRKLPPEALMFLLEREDMDTMPIQEQIREKVLENEE